MGRVMNGLALGVAALGVAACCTAWAAPRVATRLVPGEVAAGGRNPVALPRRAADVAAGGTLNSPVAVAVDANSNLYVVNAASFVNVYDKSLKQTGTIEAGLDFPVGVAVSFEGNIYVANAIGNNVTIYNPQLAQIGTITDSALAEPQGIYIDADDTVWVTDAPGYLHAYLSDGAVLKPSFTGGTVVGPWGPNVTVWGIFNTSGGYNEAYENRAQAVQSGPCLCSVFPDGSPAAGGETEDALGQQYVSDQKNDLVQIWSSNGLSVVGVIPTPQQPDGVAVDNALHRLYVAVASLNEVYVYSTKAPYRQLAVLH